MPVFGDAYLADTHHLTLEEHGAYWKLLLIAWRTSDCALPNDDKRLAMMLGLTPKKWAKLKPIIMAFWKLEDGRWRQKRQTNVRRFVEEKREQNREAANARWNNQGSENKGNGSSERISGRNSERTSGRYASQTQTHSSVISDDITAAESGEAFDPVKELIDRGIEVLREGSIPEKQARSMIGQWRAKHGDDAVALAIAAASGRNLSQPLEWIAKRLHVRAAEGRTAAPAGGQGSIAQRILARKADEEALAARKNSQPKTAGATQ